MIGNTLLRYLIILNFLVISAAVSSAKQSLSDSFNGADINEKYRILDSLLTSDSIPTDFFRTLMTTDDFRQSFPSLDVYHVLISRTAIKLFDISNPEIMQILKLYYYGGPRSRKLYRPKTYEINYDWQKIIAQTTADDGTIWALTNIWWFGCYDDLWLIKNNSKTDNIGAGPWFTGITLHRTSSGTIEDCRLEYDQNHLHLIVPEQNIDTVISPEILTHDSDRDGLYDCEEIRFLADSRNPDSDGDKIPDGDDLNPLAGQNGLLSDEDMIKLVLFRDYCGASYEYNLYHVKFENGRKLQYFVNAPNAIIIALDSIGFAQSRNRFGEYDELAPLSVYFHIEKISDDCVEASIFHHGASDNCVLRRRDGYWFISRWLGRSH
jgi:hypothetical protein